MGSTPDAFKLSSPITWQRRLSTKLSASDGHEQSPGFLKSVYGERHSTSLGSMKEGASFFFLTSMKNSRAFDELDPKKPGVAAGPHGRVLLLLHAE